MCFILLSYHGFTFMDKQLVLSAIRLSRCRLMSYIVNTVFCWQQLIHPGEIISKSRHKEIGLVVFH